MSLLTHVAVALLLAVPPAPGSYIPPVDAPVSEPFHVEGGHYGPGNRGIEYATSPGDAIVAAADGTVVFSGTVAGGRPATIRHDDGAPPPPRAPRRALA